MIHRAAFLPQLQVDHARAVPAMAVRERDDAVTQTRIGIGPGTMPSSSMAQARLLALERENGCLEESGIELAQGGRSSLATVIHAAGRTTVSQDEVMELLAGPRQPDPKGKQVHEEVARGIRSIMDAQRLISLDTLFGLADGLNQVAKGAVAGKALLPLAGELQEFQMPQPIFTSSERTEWAAGLYNNRHTELQLHTDLTKLLKGPSSPAQLEEARGQLTPFLRDTLVGLNYAYYEPPGAQLLRVNPLFVRSHDFSGDTVVGIQGLWRAPQLFGQGSPAGGGAHFAGSLADLPFVLSDAEQDFIAPENVQALIWREAVPSLLTDAVLPRWWNVSTNELHTVALYQAAGEELVKAAASDDQLRAKVIGILAQRMLPRDSSRLELTLQTKPDEALALITPADAFYLTTEFRHYFPDDTHAWGPAGQELDRICRQYPDELNWNRLSRDFGVPHKTLAQSYARELLNLKPFPAFHRLRGPASFAPCHARDWRGVSSRKDCRTSGNYRGSRLCND